MAQVQRNALSSHGCSVVPSAASYSTTYFVTLPIYAYGVSLKPSSCAYSLVYCCCLLYGRSEPLLDVGIICSRTCTSKTPWQNRGPPAIVPIAQYPFTPIQDAVASSSLSTKSLHVVHWVLGIVLIFERPWPWSNHFLRHLELM